MKKMRFILTIYPKNAANFSIYIKYAMYLDSANSNYECTKE